ncbi:MAG TPA: hypothetical protein VHY91_02835 [Pirellulales bacterium]|jgi:hypothetical protein|nr:hypothetical protein [Pirellulales bacterium]
MRLLMLVAVAMLACGGCGQAGKPAGKTQDASITFSDRAPGVDAQVDKQLLAEVNALPRRSRQIRFLIGLLPAQDAKQKTLTPRQADAMYLLGTTRLAGVIPILIDHLEFANGESEVDFPAEKALRLVGERAVEPLVRSLQTGSARRTSIAIRTLADIKGTPFTPFAEEVIHRNDLILSADTISDLLLFARARDALNHEPGQQVAMRGRS